MELNDILEAARYHWLVFMCLPVLLLITSPVYGSQEMPVFRLQQFDLSGSAFGKHINVPMCPALLSLKLVGEFH